MFVNITAKIKDDSAMKISLHVVKFLYVALKGCV